MVQICQLNGHSISIKIKWIRIHLGEYLKLGVGALPIAQDTQELKQENTRLGVRRIITDPRLKALQSLVRPSLLQQFLRCHFKIGRRHSFAVILSGLIPG